MARSPDLGHGSQRLEERRAKGAEWRRQVPLGAQAEWTPPANRADPVEVLIEQGKGRIAELLPVRYGRMKTDPFAFLRGAAAIMAADLAAGPSTGLRVQACGDCHLANFGAYTTPEGRRVYDLNDFDETLPAPFEWDIKRLAASLAVKGRAVKMSEQDCRNLARTVASRYRKHLASLARLPPLDAWSERIGMVREARDIGSAKIRRKLIEHLAAAKKAGTEHFGLLEKKGGSWRIKENPSKVRRLSQHELPAAEAFTSYLASLQDDRRALLQRYRLEDVAFKAVGVGSVGTFCAIGLLLSDGDAPLLLQIKEAQPSVLARFAGLSHHANHGERVVIGQRMMQAATDVFLGWTQNPVAGRFFYVRRVKDPRLADIDTVLEEALPFYAGLCGRALARAHARSGDAVALAAYMGDDGEFDKAIAAFAVAYADQTTRDWHTFRDAIKAGRISAEEASTG